MSFQMPHAYQTLSEIQEMFRTPDNKRCLEVIAVTESLLTTDDNGDTQLHIALRNGSSLEIVKTLLTTGILEVKNCDGDAPLHIASRCGASLEVMEFLAAIEPPVDSSKVPSFLGHGRTHLPTPNGFGVKDNNGNTPLHVALCYGAPLEIIKLLLFQEIFDIEYHHTNEPARIISGDGFIKIMETLPFPNILYAKNNNGDTPLHVALKHSSSLEVVEMLAEKEILHERNYHQDTPLPPLPKYDGSDEAARRAFAKEIIKRIKNCGDTPLQTALRYKCSQEIVNVLEKSGKFKNGVSLDAMEFLIGQKSLNARK